MKRPAAGLAALLVTLSAGRALAAGDEHFARQLEAIRAVQRGAAPRVEKVLQGGKDDPERQRQERFTKVVERVIDSVALLAAKGKGGEEKGTALCTGFFVNGGPLGKTVIASNSHCVEHLKPGDEIDGALYKNPRETVPAKMRILAFGDSDAAKDIALLELVDASQNRKELTLWDDVSLGEEVFAIGHPLGFSYSVTRGIISGLNRDRLRGSFVLDVHQTDAAVNSGNSGGPLFDMWGSVIAINSMIVPASAGPFGGGGFNGLAFSLPASYITRALEQFSRTGDLKPGSLHIMFGPDKNGTLLVQQVIEGGQAEKAGLKKDDQIISLDRIELGGRPIPEAMRDFIAHVKYRSPKEKVTVVVRRGSETLSIEVEVGDKPAVKEEVKRPKWAPRKTVEELISAGGGVPL